MLGSWYPILSYHLLCPMSSDILIRSNFWVARPFSSLIPHRSLAPGLFSLDMFLLLNFPHIDSSIPGLVFSLTTLATPHPAQSNANVNSARPQVRDCERLALLFPSVLSARAQLLWTSGPSPGSPLFSSLLWVGSGFHKLNSTKLCKLKHIMHTLTSIPPFFKNAPAHPNTLLAGVYLIIFHAMKTIGKLFGPLPAKFNIVQCFM